MLSSTLTFTCLRRTQLQVRQVHTCSHNSCTICFAVCTCKTNSAFMCSIFTLRIKSLGEHTCPISLCSILCSWSTKKCLNQDLWKENFYVHLVPFPENRHFNLQTQFNSLATDRAELDYPSLLLLVDWPL